MASFGDDYSETESLPDRPSSEGGPMLPDPGSEGGNSDDVDPRSDNVESSFPNPEFSEEAGEETSDSGNESDDRENRFIGPSSTWRFYTEDERSLAASLDQQRANDLSLHLYNAHALKSRVRDPGVLPNANTSRKRKQRFKVDEDGSLPWYPEETWTSWPLKPEDVPRREERFGVPVNSAEHEATTIKKVEPWDPRVDLEEEIQALMLRKATEKLRERGMEESLGTEETKLLVDEDEAHTALRPTARHVLSQLDALFEKLRKNRQRYACNKSQARQRRSRSRSGPRLGRKSSSRETKNTEHSNEDESEFDDGESTDSEKDTELGKSTQRVRQRRPLNPNDWKAILHAASFVGFERSAVDRAAARCASIFGESMTAPSYDCPIEDCGRHGRPFEKAWRWREHLRRTHKYSLEDVYKIEAGANPVDIKADREERSIGPEKID